MRTIVITPFCVPPFSQGLQAMAQRTTMSSAELNNCAISHLQAGQVQEAMHHLMIALSSVRQPCEPCKASSKRSSSVSVFGSALSLAPQDSSFLLRYNRALFIDTSVPLEDDSIVSAVILFNTAQVQHSIGIECDNMDILEQASRLYRMALVILNKFTITGNRLLLLAILNNIAHVDSHLFRMGDVVDSLGKIRTMMTAVNLDRDMNTIEEKDLRLFTMNATFDQKIVLTLAPAA